MIRKQQHPVVPTISSASRETNKQSALLSKKIIYHILIIGLVTLASIFWVIGLRTVDPHNLNDLGLLSVLPISIHLSTGLLCMAVGLILTHERFYPEYMLLVIVIIIFYLFGITAIVEEMPRFSVNYIHSGFSEYILRTGKLATWADARFSWPGFFVVLAYMTGASDFTNAIPFMAWTPVLLNLMYLFPMYTIFTSITSDKRRVWLAMWLYVITNWIGQDYLSPQGFNYFLYLMILAVLLNWFKAITQQQDVYAPRWLKGFPLKIWEYIFGMLISPDIPNAEATLTQKKGLIICIVFISLAIASSHQLTPIVLIISVGLISFFRRITPQGLVIIIGTIVVAWIFFMATAFISGHLQSVLDEVGQINQTLSSNVTEKAASSLERIIVLQSRIVMTLSLWGLAGLAILRQLISRQLEFMMLLLAGSPVLAMFMQSYGGEMLLRIYFFALPFVVFFISAHVTTLKPQIPTPYLRILLILFSFALIMMFWITRYGNERMDYVSADEFAGFDYLYKNAPAGSLIVVVAPNLPWKYENWEQFDYAPLRDDYFVVGELNSIYDYINERNNPTNYVLISRSQKAFGELYYGMSVGWGEILEDQMEASEDFHIEFKNRDVMIARFEPKS